MVRRFAEFMPMGPSFPRKRESSPMVPRASGTSSIHAPQRARGGSTNDGLGAQVWRQPDESLPLKELAREYLRYGYRSLHGLLSSEGLVVNRKHTYRLYREEGLQVRRQRRKKLSRPRTTLPAPTAPAQCWSMDFVSDQLVRGRRFRILNVIDDYSRECVGQIVNTSIGGERVVYFPDELGQRRALPKTLVCDNGSEFTSKAMFLWSRKAGVELHFIQPGKPVQNAYVESFNGRFRDGCLNQHCFEDLRDAKRIIADWRHHYNHVRPHSSLGYVPPAVFLENAA